MYHQEINGLFYSFKDSISFIGLSPPATHLWCNLIASSLYHAIAAVWVFTVKKTFKANVGALKAGVLNL